MRKTRADAILFKVDGKDEADQWFCHLHEAIGGSAQISKPIRTTLMFVLNIVEWLEEDQVKKDILVTNSNLVETSISERSNAGGERIA